MGPVRQIVNDRIIFFRQYAKSELPQREKERKSSHQTTAKDRFIIFQSQRRLRESCSRRVKLMAVSGGVPGLNDFWFLCQALFEVRIVSPERIRQLGAYVCNIESVHQSSRLKAPSGNPLRMVSMAEVSETWLTLLPARSSIDKGTNHSGKNRVHRAPHSGHDGRQESHEEDQ
jgi:hypothetical protein